MNDIYLLNKYSWILDTKVAKLYIRVFILDMITYNLGQYEKEEKKRATLRLTTKDL
jgi:hypothetical protein